jgi:pimeloyl-ACP methyl ester carboxylesterase
MGAARDREAVDTFNPTAFAGWARAHERVSRAADHHLGAEIEVAIAGKGPPLLLHGNPLTLVGWHKIAPSRAQGFTVVATDLRGYGDSSKPPGGPDHHRIRPSRPDLAYDASCHIFAGNLLAGGDPQPLAIAPIGSDGLRRAEAGSSRASRRR